MTSNPARYRHEPRKGMSLELAIGADQHRADFGGKPLPPARGLGDSTALQPGLVRTSQARRSTAGKDAQGYLVRRDHRMEPSVLRCCDRGKTAAETAVPVTCRVCRAGSV